MTTLLTKNDIQERLDASPFISFMNISVRSVNHERNSISMQLPMRPEFERRKGSGQFHGGVIASLIDIVGDYALAMMLGSGIPTINFRVDYLRPATKSVLLATAVVRRAGRTVGVVDIDVFDDDDRLVAVGRGCYSTKVS